MNDQKPNLPSFGVSMAKFVTAAIGLIFAGIGVTVLVFLWGAPFGEFGSPPIFFRIFGSFIALSFVIIGGAICVGSVLGVQAASDILRRMGEQGQSLDQSTDEGTTVAPAAYTCPHCGATLGAGTEVSPHGDVKCSYCNSWFNIHSSE
jgi:DNA-directed RNA polymerase subunit RPC12/RpoP